MNRITCVALVLAAALACAACIQKDVRNVVYLQPDGSAVWTILETGARSDAKSAPDRRAEEADYRRTILSNPTPLVAFLEMLGGRRVSRTVLKDTAPFEVHTSAEFDRIDALFERICASASRFCVASVHDDGQRRVLTVEVQGPLTPPAPEHPALLDALTKLTFVMADGHFVEAAGFILDNDVTAKLDDEALEDEDEAVTLRLVWERDSW